MYVNKRAQFVEMDLFDCIMCRILWLEKYLVKINISLQCGSVLTEAHEEKTPTPNETVILWHAEPGREKCINARRRGKEGATKLWLVPARLINCVARVCVCALARFLLDHTP